LGTVHGSPTSQIGATTLFNFSSYIYYIMKNKISSFASRASLALCSLGLAASVASAEISDQDFANSIEKYLKTDSGMEKIGSAMERYFQRRQQEAMKKQEEQQKAEVEEQFKNPSKIDVGGSPVKGPANAKVTIVEFSDFQCPYCKRGFETMEAVAKAYPKDVKIAFKHFPLPFHKEAEPAARAAWAAQQQGKFWEFHEALFNNQDKLGAEFYIQAATDLKLNVEKFKTDMASEAAAKQVKADTEIGQKNGIQGTPGFFVNGVAVKGAYPVDHFKGIIDRWLKGDVAAKN
jgi:protein-disulfide isomerase